MTCFELLKNLNFQGESVTLCPTRWTVRSVSIQSVLDNYEPLCAALANISDSSDDSGAKARGFLRSMELFSTFFGLRASLCVFEQAEIANTTLQDIQLTAAKAKSISVRTAEIIATMSSVAVFNRLYDKTCRASRSMGHFRAHSAKDSTSTAKTG